MRSLALGLAAIAFVSSPALALSPASETFLRSAGLDPASEDVRLADKDGTIIATYEGDREEYSLESLAKKGRKHGVSAFVHTRKYIRGLKADFANTPQPSGDFLGLYLTAKEWRLVRRKRTKMAETSSQETREYLKSIGLDPDSEEVFEAELAGAVETGGGAVSLESLVREKKDAELLRFVAGKKKAAPAAAPALVYVAPSSPAMTPATAKYLSSIGIDPNSEAVIAVAEEGSVISTVNEDPEEYSLAQLAAEKKKNAVRRFIHTRTFIGMLKKDFEGTSIPKTGYEPRYLTHEELGLAGRKFVSLMFKKKN